MKTFLSFLVKSFFPAALITVSVLFCLSPVSCSSFAGDLNFLQGDFTVPQLSSFSVQSDEKATVSFSKDIKNISATMKINSLNERVQLFTHYDSSSKTADITFPSKTETGEKYTIEGEVEDTSGNTLTFSIPFTGFNANPAIAVISEVRNAYATTTVSKVTNHKSEFVELYVIKSGNLCGLEISSASDGESKKYTFPNIEVSEGEYITVHMRTPKPSASCPTDGEGAVSETGSDLTLSTHTDSCDTARDLWSENSSAVFADTDIITLTNSFTGEILDCLLMAKSSASSWKESFKEVVEKIVTAGKWHDDSGNISAAIENAVCTDDISSSAAGRSISRQNLAELIKSFKSSTEENFNFSNTASAFLITADTGSGSKKIIGVTPGYENSSNAYVK